MENSSTSLLRNESARGSSGKLRLLPRAFYEAHSLEVAQALLGKVLVVQGRNGRGSPVAARIVETEAYRAGDAASHSARGNTPRTSVMFGKPGNAYVYFIYGMYEMLNFVTEPEGKPGAVLIRAVEPLQGEDRMQKRRPKAKNRHQLTSGPGKLCVALGISLSHNGQSLQGPELFVYNDGYQVKSISESPRVGISQAAEMPWRFFITDHPFVSRVKENKLAKILR